MELTSLSPIQQEIVKALNSLGDKARYSEAILAKKIRENAKIDGKKKAGIALADLEKAMAYLEESSGLHYALMMNSANDLLIEKSETARPLEPEVHSRRLRSEKSMSIFTSSDLNSKKSEKKAQKRSDRRKLNTAHGYDMYEE